MRNQRVYIIFSLILLFTQFQNCSDVNFATVEKSLVDGGPLGYNSIQQDFPFAEPAPAKVDILLVDDNSGSMSERQKSLAQKFPQFIGLLSNLDWQLAVTTTDVTGDYTQPNGGTSGGARGRFIGPQGQLPTYSPDYMMTPATPDVEIQFAKTVQRNSEVGSGDERGIYAANLVVDAREDFAKDFFRPNSNLVIIILSDEDERSNGTNLENYDLPQTLIDKVTAAFGPEKKLLVNSIIGIPNEASSCKATVGRTYDALTVLTGGYVGSICDATYDDSLTGIAGAIQWQNSELVLQLQHAPLTTPLVTFTPGANAVDYSITDKEVILATRPASGTIVHVSYDY